MDICGQIPGSMVNVHTHGHDWWAGADIAGYCLLARSGRVLRRNDWILFVTECFGQLNPAFAMPWYWHMVVGFAFGAFFMATDPVASAMTDQAVGLTASLSVSCVC